MALENNGIVSLFTRSAPEFGGITFDAQIRHNFKSSSRITSFQTETGASVNNHIVFDPVTIEMELGVGSSELFSWGGFASQNVIGFISNLAGSAFASLVLGALSSVISGSGTRGGSVLESLLALQVGGIESELNVANIGFFPRMIVVDIAHSRSFETGQGDTFVVRFQQRKGTSADESSVLRESADIKDEQSGGLAPVTDITEG